MLRHLLCGLAKIQFPSLIPQLLSGNDVLIFRSGYFNKVIYVSSSLIDCNGLWLFEIKGIITYHIHYRWSWQLSLKLIFEYHCKYHWIASVWIQYVKNSLNIFAHFLTFIFISLRITEENMGIVLRCWQSQWCFYLFLEFSSTTSSSEKSWGATTESRGKEKY